MGEDVAGPRRVPPQSRGNVGPRRVPARLVTRSSGCDLDLVEQADAGEL